jgi:hypothetical protein
MPNPAPVLSETQARALARAETEVTRAEAALDAAVEARGVLRERYKTLVPVATKPADAKKGVREISMLGGKVRITPTKSGKFFKLSEFIEAGHRITRTMRPFVGGETPYDRWTVKLPDATA